MKASTSPVASVLGALVSDLLNAHVGEVLLEQVAVLVIKGGAVVTVEPPGDAMPAEDLGEDPDVVLSCRALDHHHLWVLGESVHNDQDVVSVTV